MARKHIIDDDLQLEPEYRESYMAWKANPSPATATPLIKKLSPIIDSALTSYGWTSSPTLRSRARVMAIESLKSYDPTRGNIRTHLLSQLRGLRRVASAEQNLVKVPEYVALERRKIQDAEKELALELGYEPSTAQVADRTGLPIRRIAAIRRAKIPVTIPRGVSADDGSEYDVASTAAATIPGHDPGFEAWVDFVYGDLSPRDQVILDYSMGLHGRTLLPANEIAKKLNITPSAVSQRMARIKALLDERPKLHLF